MVEIDWEIQGIQFFERRLRQMARRVEFPEPVLVRIGEEWLTWIEEQFETEGVRFLGHKWTKLSRDRAARRKSTHPILIDHADLLLAMTDPANLRVTADHITLDIHGEQARIGGFHQSGTSKMPARPILNWSELDRRRMYAHIKDWLFEETGWWKIGL